MDPIRNSESKIPTDLGQTNPTSNGTGPENLSPNLNPETDPAPDQSISPAHPELQQIRTFQGDVANALQNNNESLVSIQRAEHAHRALNQPTETESSKMDVVKKGALLFLGSLVLITLGIGGGWYAFREYKVRTAVPEFTSYTNQFISSAAETKIDATNISRSSLIQEISKAGALDLTAGQVRHIQLLKGQATTTLLSSREFFTALEGSESSRLVRAFDNNFMLGALGVTPRPVVEIPVEVSTSTVATTTVATTTAATSTEPVIELSTVGHSIFLIFKLSSFENAFAGMLDWEKSIASDIGPLFSTSPFLQTLTAESVFKDETRYNKDLRVLRTPTNQVILLYTFFDNRALIITDNEETLKTLISRLESELLSR